MSWLHKNKNRKLVPNTRSPFRLPTTTGNNFTDERSPLCKENLLSFKIGRAGAPSSPGRHGCPLGGQGKGPTEAREHEAVGQTSKPQTASKPLLHSDSKRFSRILTAKWELVARKGSSSARRMYPGEIAGR